MEIDQEPLLPVATDAEESSIPAETAEDPPVLNAAGRVARKRRPTWKILERLPAPPTPIPDVVNEGISTQPAQLTPPPAQHTPPPADPVTSWDAVHTTVRNIFGLYREFPTYPTHNPDDILTLGDLADSQPPPTVVDAPQPISRLSIPTLTPVSLGNNSNGPFANSSIFGLLNWMWTGSAMKSVAECSKLFSFLQSDAFRKEDIMGVDFMKETAKLDEYMGFNSARPTKDTITPAKDGWHESEITIQVPDAQEHDDASIPTFAVPGLHHRSITAVIRSVFEDPVASRRFHYTPFKSFWKSSETSPAQRIYDEIYSSDAMLEAHMKLQKSRKEPGCELERVIASLMFWSDSTHLANFGTASLWPLYLFFGNQSKYLRNKPCTASCHHIAYIPKVCGVSLFRYIGTNSQCFICCSYLQTFMIFSQL